MPLTKTCHDTTGAFPESSISLVMMVMMGLGSDILFLVLTYYTRRKTKVYLCFPTRVLFCISSTLAGQLTLPVYRRVVLSSCHPVTPSPDHPLTGPVAEPVNDDHASTSKPGGRRISKRRSV